jgi:hypothetical protein
MKKVMDAPNFFGKNERQPNGSVFGIAPLLFSPITWRSAWCGLVTNVLQKPFGREFAANAFAFGQPIQMCRH